MYVHVCAKVCVQGASCPLLLSALFPEPEPFPEPAARLAMRDPSVSVSNPGCNPSDGARGTCVAVSGSPYGLEEHSFFPAAKTTGFTGHNSLYSTRNTSSPVTLVSIQKVSWGHPAAREVLLSRYDYHRLSAAAKKPLYFRHKAGSQISQCLSSGELTQVSMKAILKFKVKIALEPQRPHITMFSAWQRQRSTCASRSPSPGSCSSSHHSLWIWGWVVFSVPCPVEKNVKMNYFRGNKYFGWNTFNDLLHKENTGTFVLHEPRKAASPYLGCPSTASHVQRESLIVLMLPTRLLFLSKFQFIKIKLAI